MTLRQSIVRRLLALGLLLVTVSPICAQDGSTAAATLWDVTEGAGPIAFSPDGRTMFTGGLVAATWDIATGKLRYSLASADYVFSAAFTPDSRRLATAGVAIKGNGDRFLPKVAVWDVATRKELLTLKDLPWDDDAARAAIGFEGFAIGPLRLAVAPDGKALATGGSTRKGDEHTGIIQVWDLANGKERFVLNGRPGLVGPVAYSPDGRMLAVVDVGPQLSITIWELASRQRRTTILLPASVPPRAIAFAPDSTAIAWATGSLANDSSDLVLYPLFSGKQAVHLAGHRGGVSSVAFTPDGKTLGSAGFDGTIRIWDTTQHKETALLHVFAPERRDINIAFSPDGKVLAATRGSDRRGSIRLWDLPSLAPRLSPAETARRSQEAAEQQELLRLRQQQKREGPRSIASDTALASRYGYMLHLQLARQALEYGRPAHALALLDKELPEPAQAADLRSFEWHYIRSRCDTHAQTLTHIGRIHQAHLGATGKTLVCAAFDNRVTVWDAASGKKRADLTDLPEWLRAVELSADGTVVATAGGKKDDPRTREVSLWESATGKLLATLGGHAGMVRCVAFSPDGKLLATAGQDAVIRLWEMPSGRAAGELGKLDREVLALAFAPDGKRLASGERAGTVCLWDLPSRKLWHTLTPAVDRWVATLQFDPHGNRLLVTQGGQLFEENSVHVNAARATLWNVAPNGKPIVRHTWPDMVHGVFSPDGAKLAIVGSDYGMLWDLLEGREINRFATGRSYFPLAAATFAPDGKHLAVAHRRGQDPLTRVCRYNVVTGREEGRYESAFGTPADVRLDNNGRVTIVGIDDHEVQVVSALLGNEPFVRRAAQFMNGRMAAFAPNGNMIAVCDDTNSVKQWDLDTGKERTIWSAAKFKINDLALSSDGKTLMLFSNESQQVVYSYPVTVKLLDVATGQERATVETTGGMVCSNGTLVAAGDKDETITIWEVATGRKRNALESPRTAQLKKQPAGTEPQSISKVLLSPGGRWVAGRAEDGAVTLWDLSTGKAVKSWSPITAPVNLALGPRDDTLLTADSDGNLKVWNLPALTARAFVPKAWLVDGACVFSADGKLAAVVASASTVMLFDPLTGDERPPLVGHATQVTCLTFAPDSRTLVTGTQGGAIKCWDPIIGEERLWLRHTDAIARLLFSTGGRTLASTDKEGWLRVWNAPLVGQD